MNLGIVPLFRPKIFERSKLFKYNILHIIKKKKPFQYGSSTSPRYSWGGVRKKSGRNLSRNVKKVVTIRFTSPPVFIERQMFYG